MIHFSPRSNMRIILAIGASSLALAATPALAQESGAKAEEGGNTEIIVTAQFREQRLQDIPLAITAVNAEMLQAKNQTDISQVADRAPNVSLRKQGASFGPSISASIRGVGQTDFSPAYEPGVGIYIDDVYYPQLTGAAFDLLDLERVEILRGPQGTLAGRNSIGGSIKMFSKRPTGSNTGFVEAQYGSRNKIGLRASADFGLTDELSARLSGVYKSQDGYVDVLDYGCVHPQGNGETFINESGVAQEYNPAVNGIAALSASGNCKVGEQGDVNYQAVRGVLRYNSSSIDLDVMLSADYTRDRRSNAAEVLAATKLVDNANTNIGDVTFDDRFICGKFCNYTTLYQAAGTFSQSAFLDGIFGADGEPLNEYRGENKTTYDGYNFAANVSVGVNDWISVDNILAYGAFDSAFDTDGDLSPITLGNGHNDLSHWHWSEELRVNLQPVDTVNIVLGGYWFEQSTTYFSYQDLRYVSVYPLQFQQPDKVDANSKAAFANLAWEIAPDFNFNAGIRYTDESKTYNYFRLNLDGTVNRFLDSVGAACGIGFSGVDTADCNGNGDTTEVLRALTGNPAIYKGDNIDYRIALDYRFSDEFMVYGSIATGFKGGGTNPRPFNAYQAISFDPETLTSYEIGFKSDLLDRRLRLNVTGFYSEYSDIQIGVSECPLIDGAPATTPTTPCAARVNAGDGEYLGIEAEVFAEPVDGFTIDASFSYLDFKYTELLAAASYPTSAGGVEADDPPLNTPKLKASIGMQYEVSLGDAGSITPRLDVEHTGKIFYGTDRFSVAGERQRLFLPSVTLANARLTWKNADADLTVSLEARNLFNKYHYVTIFDLRNSGTGSAKAVVSPPREIALTVRKHF